MNPRKSLISRHKKKCVWATGIVGTLFILLLALVLILPSLINLAPVKEKIQASVSQAVGGEVQFNRVDLSFFPHLSVVVRQGRVSIPGKLAGDVESVTICPEFLPLLIGQVRISMLKIEAPEVKINLPERAKQNNERLRRSFPATVEEKIASALAMTALKAPGLVVVVEKGVLDLSRKGKSIFRFQGIRVRIGLPPNTFEMDEHKTTVALTELHLDHPQLNMTGKLVMDQTSQLVSLELEGRELDIGSTRDAALALAGDTPAVRDIFDILKGGKVPLITFNAKGNAMADLGEMENIVITGRMLEGKIFVPGADLDLEEVKGEVVISQDILHGSNLEARLGGSLGRNGILKLGLAGNNAPFHLDIEADADLAQLPPILKHLIDDESFVKEIDLIENVKGRAKGRLLLGESTAEINTRVDVSEFHVSANYRRVPFSLEVRGGHFFYDGTGIDVENVSGKMGKTSFSEISGGLDWGKEPYLDLKSGRSEMFLDEIHPWSASFECLSVYRKYFKTVKGIIAFSAMNIKGPLFRPQDWHFEIAGQVMPLVVDTSLLPGPIEISKGGFRAIKDGVKQKLFFQDAQATMLDASLRGSGVLNDYMVDLNRVDISLEGDMGPESIRWLSDLIHMPPEVKVRSPLSVSRGRLVWDRGGRASVTGDLVVDHGPNVSIDILQDPEELRIKHLLIEDRESCAHIKLNVKKKEFDFEFSGHVTETTMHNLFEKDHLSQGRINGDFRAHILMDEPVKSTAQGKLIGQDLVFPWKLGVPLKIESVSLDATKDGIKVDQAVFMLADKRLMLKGNVKASAAGFVLDMDLSADDIEWDQLTKVLEDNGENAGQDKDLWDLPVQGVLRLKSKTFKYETFTWTPFHANISFSHDEIGVAVTEANLCGISTPGVLMISPQELLLRFKPVSKGLELAPTLACFGDKEGPATGRFDLKGKVIGQVKSEELARSIRGDLEFVANDGRIHHLGVLAKIFAFLNVTEVFRGKFPDFGKEGFAYNSIEAKGNIQDGKLVMKEAIMDAPSMRVACKGYIDFINKELDLKVLVAPLKTVDSIIEKIPLVSYIFGDTLVSIPVKVTGDWTDPEVTPLAASAVGSGLLGIVERTFMLPVKITEVLTTDEK